MNYLKLSMCVYVAVHGIMYTKPMVSLSKCFEAQLELLAE